LNHTLKFILPMKLTLILLASLLAAAAHAQYLTNTYSQNVNTIVPDDNPNGLASTIYASGVPGAIQSISVTLHVSNGFTGDYYAYLVDPNGDLAVLLNRVGVGAGNPFGYGDSGFNITLSSAATDNIHYYQSGAYSLNPSGELTGTWQADGRNIDPNSNPAAFNSAATTSGLNQIPGTDANGAWTLFVADVSGGYEGTLVNWAFTVVTVPEPSPAELLGLAGALGALVAWRRR
jgi:subtilisin-like proprotein convertase family protein